MARGESRFGRWAIGSTLFLLLGTVSAFLAAF
jgi:hypothetical protein